MKCMSRIVDVEFTCLALLISNCVRLAVGHEKRERPRHYKLSSLDIVQGSGGFRGGVWGGEPPRQWSTGVHGG